MDFYLAKHGLNKPIWIRPKLVSFLKGEDRIERERREKERGRRRRRGGEEEEKERSSSNQKGMELHGLLKL